MKIKVLTYDTETTGLPLNWNKPAEDDLNNWPHIVQLGASFIEIDLDEIISNDKYKPKELYKIDTLVVPIRNGRELTIHPKAEATHGFNLEMCHKGNIIETVLFILQGMHIQADLVICHNRNFDRNVFVSEMLNLGYTPKAKANSKVLCTMQYSTDILKLPGQYGKYKWPNLSELSKYYLGKDVDNAHNAMGDVQATQDCFLEMIKEDNVMLEWLQGKRQSIY